MTRLWTGSLWLTLLLVGTAHAQSADELTGVWKRLKTADSKESWYLFEAEEGGVKATLLNPPEGLSCTVNLSLEGADLKGQATFEEADFDPIVSKWEFALQENGQLKGRTEWVAWDENDNEQRGWEDHTLVRAEKVGLVTEGEGEEPYGDPVEDLASLAGGWKGHGGGWELKVAGEKLTLVPVGHDEGVAIDLSNDRGTLKGQAKLPSGKSCDVELAQDDGKLAGRISWVAAPELGDKAVKGWAPFSFERLEPVEAGPADADAGAPPAGEGSPVGVWKRDDGLYLRIREDGGQTVGVLSDASGEAKCRLRFEQKDGVWSGLANWGDYETKWELSVTEGNLVGRAEWITLHEGTIVTRGWSGRTFTKLQRVR